MKIFALIVFIVMYLFIILKPKYRPIYALAAAVVFLVSGILPFTRLLSTINWNVLMMISGTMVIVNYFIESQMPNRIADLILEKAKNIMWATILMSLFAGIISAFIDNVATVLMVAPVGLAICRKQKVNPVGMIVSIAVSSNLQGAATLVGDTTSIMLGDYANMNFTDFFWMEGRPGIFFAVELGALATIPIMMFLFRKEKKAVSVTTRTEVTNYFPSFMLVLMVFALITASFIKNAPSIINGIICCALAVITIVYHSVKEKSLKGAVSSVKNLDFETLGLLLGLFIVIGGITEVGIIDDFAGFLVKNGSGNIFLLYTIIVWGSIAISAVVDNIPYVATMLPVLSTVTTTLGINPYLLYFGLLSGATLGGNITPIGASANIAATGLLRKNGNEVSFKQFICIGLPYTLAAVLTGYLFIWFVWK